MTKLALVSETATWFVTGATAGLVAHPLAERWSQVSGRWKEGDAVWAGGDVREASARLHHPQARFDRLLRCCKGWIRSRKQRFEHDSTGRKRRDMDLPGSVGGGVGMRCRCHFRRRGRRAGNDVLLSNPIRKWLANRFGSRSRSNLCLRPN